MSKPRLIIAVERDGSQVSYSSTGRSATRERRTGPARPCSGEITLSLTWRSRQSATRPPTSPGSIRSEAKITRSTLAGERVEGLDLVLVDELEVHVGEELELAADHLGEVAVAEHRRDLGRGQRAARATARRRAAPGRRPPRRSRRRPRRSGSTSPGRRLRQDQRQHPDPAPPPRRRSPDQLVDGQVADRNVVAVVEADQLREHAPSRAAGRAPRRRRRGRGDDQARGGGGDQVGEREHAAAQGVAPEARPTGLVGAARLEARSAGGPCH